MIRYFAESAESKTLLLSLTTAGVTAVIPQKRDVNNCVVHNETATLSILLIKLHGRGIECRTPKYSDSKFRSGSKVSVVCELYIPPTAGRWFVPFDEPKMREVL